MKLGGKRGVIMVRFAGGNDPVEFLHATRCGVQRFLRCSRAQDKFIFAFSSVSQRYDAGTPAKFAHRHSKSTIYVLCSNDPRASHSSGRNNRNFSRIRRLTLVLACRSLGRQRSSSDLSIASDQFFIFTSEFNDFLEKQKSRKAVEPWNQGVLEECCYFAGSWGFEFVGGAGSMLT